jgi:hypothetical protein
MTFCLFAVVSMAKHIISNVGCPTLMYCDGASIGEVRRENNGGCFAEGSFAEGSSLRDGPVRAVVKNTLQ